MGAFAWAICWAGILQAAAGRAADAAKALQGTWEATSAVREGKAAPDLVGHRLSFAAGRFTIRSRGGKVLYRGTFRADPGVKPAAIDFTHAEGALKGKTWKGVYALEGGTLRVCDNGADPDKGRPAGFRTTAGSGHVCLVFKRVRP
jgi:uncharacterized protein (TIGR03067 family)